MTRRIVVVGAGIVGTLVAHELAADPGVHVTVLERAGEGVLPGSTGHAPGFVGLYNEDETHVTLAVNSAEMFDAFPASFRRVGAYDVAETDEGAQQLIRRAKAARRCGLDVREVPVAQATQAAPALVDPERVILALHSTGDGAADAVALTQEVRAAAAARGARFVFDAPVRDIRPGRGGLVVETEMQTGVEQLPADDVVLAAGLWGGALAEIAGAEQVIVPVGHPYIYSRPQTTQIGGPLVRFRERAIYTRAHGDRLGMGCYAHAAFDATHAITQGGAEVAWAAELFDPVVRGEIEALPPASRFVPEEQINGVFSMTPDARPYIGAAPQVSGLWTAQAIWVTHAGGAARLLADVMLRGADEDPAFSPARFAGQDPTTLRERSLALY